MSCNEHKFFTFYDFPDAINVPDSEDAIIVGDMIESDFIKYETDFPYLRAALIRKLEKEDRRL